MRGIKKFLVLLAAIISVPVALARDQLPAILAEPFKPQCDDKNKHPPRILNQESPSELRRDIRDDLDHPQPDDGKYYFCLAERMKRVGDYRAEEFYEKAIQSDDKNPKYELAYADYLRNFRGAEAPLFPQAEEHYFRALAKIRVITGGKPYPRSGTDTQSVVERGLIALYQEDGVPLAYRDEKPYAFFSTIDRYQQSPADLDREADVRDYTSEALFAESLQGPLRFGELKRLIRNKKAFETLDRVRFRYNAWPSIDVFYTHRQTDNAQITIFSLPDIDAPTNFNELRQNDFGIAARKPLDLGSFDANIATTYRYVERWGLIQFFPDAHENIRQFDGKATFSRFVGPDKANLDLIYTHQWIQTARPKTPDREREFIGVTATYQFFRGTTYQNRFETRGWDFFAGFLTDNESFIVLPPPLGTPPTTFSSYPRRRDYFLGTSPKGMLGGRFDLTLRATRFTSDVEGISLQKNSQLRGDMTALIRIIDEEQHGNGGIPGCHPERPKPHLAFVHLVGGFREDGALTGLDAYANHKWGIGLDSSFYTTGNRTTYFLSARYDRERYFNLNRNADIFSARFSIGF
jgi:tetratricopeptide (TPR) repeat protein